MVPYDFAVCGVKERHSKAPEVERAVCHALGIPFRLSKNVLGAKRELFGLGNPDNPTLGTKCVVGWTTLRRVFFNGAAVIRIEGLTWVVRHNPPTGCLDLGIYEFFTCFSFVRPCHKIAALICYPMS